MVNKEEGKGKKRADLKVKEQRYENKACPTPRAAYTAIYSPWLKPLILSAVQYPRNKLLPTARGISLGPENILEQTYWPTLGTVRGVR
jgi:hypothetical protein